MLYIEDVKKLPVLADSILPVSIDGQEYPGVLTYTGVLPPVMPSKQTLDAFAETYRNDVLRHCVAHVIIQELYAIANWRNIAFIEGENEQSQWQLLVFKMWLSENGYIVREYNTDQEAV